MFVRLNVKFGVITEILAGNMSALNILRKSSWGRGQS